MKNKIYDIIITLFAITSLTFFVACDKNNDNLWGEDYQNSNEQNSYSKTILLNGKTYYVSDLIGTWYNYPTNYNGGFSDRCYYRVVAYDVSVARKIYLSEGKYSVEIDFSFNYFDPQTTRQGTLLTIYPDNGTLRFNNILVVSEEYEVAEYTDTRTRYKFYDLDLPLTGSIKFVAYTNEGIILDFNNVTFTFDKDMYNNDYRDYSNHSYKDNTVTLNGRILFEKKSY